MEFKSLRRFEEEDARIGVEEFLSRNNSEVIFV